MVLHRCVRRNDERRRRAAHRALRARDVGDRVEQRRVHHRSRPRTRRRPHRGRARSHGHTSPGAVMNEQTPLQQLAMLASLNISMWTARKYDRKVTQETTKSHAADEDAGRFNKLLVPKEAIAPLEQQAGAARREHDQWTMPWGNNGERLLPGEKFMDYTAAMKLHRAEFWKRFAVFEQEYPTLKANARRLGSMYDPRDFPDQIRFSSASPSVASVSMSSGLVLAGIPRSFLATSVCSPARTAYAELLGAFAAFSAMARAL